MIEMNHNSEISTCVPLYKMDNFILILHCINILIFWNFHQNGKPVKIVKLLTPCVCDIIIRAISLSVTRVCDTYNYPALQG